MLKYRKLLFYELSTIWENTYVCAEQYRRDTVLYLLPMLAHECNIITDYGVRAPGYGREAFGSLNYTDKRFISMLI